MKYVLLILTTLCIISCSVYKNDRKAKDIQGSFIGKNSQDEINFNNGKFVLRNLPSEFIDTLSYGRWEIENNFIALYSDEKISTDFFNVEVQESFSGVKDSIYISIENPSAGLYDAKDTFTPYFYYSVDLFFTDNQGKESEAFIKKISFFENEEAMKFSFIIAPNLIIYPEEISGKAFRTFMYKVKISKNNTFKVKILGFDKRSFAVKKFNGEYIKIMDKNNLIWNNELFVRTHPD